MDDAAGRPERISGDQPPVSDAGHEGLAFHPSPTLNTRAEGQPVQSTSDTCLGSAAHICLVSGVRWDEKVMPAQ